MMNEKEFQFQTEYTDQAQFPETEAPSEAEQPIESQEQQQDQPQKDHKQSWKELREKAELAEKYQRERDEYLRVLKYIEQQALLHNKNNQNQEPDEDQFDYNKLSDDDLLSGKELKKALAAEERKRQRDYEELLRQQKAAQEAASEQQLKNKYDDLYDVLNEQNIAKLREMRPGLARSLHMNPDFKEKAEETYQAIKDLGIYKSNNAQDYGDSRINRNMSKPKSSNSVFPQSGDTPLNQANLYASGNLTKELQQKLYKEMMEKAGWV